MKKRFILSMMILLLVFSSCSKKELIREQGCIEKNPIDDIVSQDSIIRGLNEFSFELYRELNQSYSENIFFSPLSISAALAMTYAGAENTTAAEMRNTMNFGPQRMDFHKEYGNVLDTLSMNNEDFEMNIANAIWVQKKYALLKKYQSIVQNAYLSESRELDFEHQGEVSRSIINSWVEDKTNNRIKDLIPPNVITPDTRLILTNAVYFNAEWANPFNEKMTRKEPFYLLDGSEIFCDMMYQSYYFQYSQSARYQILEIPYKGYDYSMIIILPKTTLGINQLIDKLDVSVLEKHDENKKGEEVQVNFPKFKMDTDYSLVDALYKMGMHEAFSTQADFSAMTGGKDLMISDIIHKAFIEVDEKKTEAAAATAVIMKLTSMPSVPKMPIEFRADHPFIFMIRHNATKAIIFMGQISKPELK
jgi:serpin B